MIGSYFMRNSTVRIFAFAMNVMIAFVMTPFITTVLGKDSYGGWALISSIQGYFNLLDLGVMNAMSRHGSAAIGANDAEKLQRLFSTAFFLNLSSFAVAAAIVAALPAVYKFILADAFDKTVASPLLVFGGLLTCILVSKALQGMLMAHLQWTVIALIGLGRSLLVAVSLFVWLTTDGGLLQMAWINGIGLWLEAVILGVICLRRFRIRPRLGDIRLREAREIISYGVSIVTIGVGEALRYRTQVFVVGRFCGLGEVALVSIALQFINYFINFMLSAFGIMTPYFARLSGQATQKDCLAAFRGAIQPCVLSATFVGLSLIFYGDIIIQHWLGSTYRSAYDVLVPFAIGAMFASSMMPANAMMLSTDRHACSSRWSLVEGLAIFFATLIFVPRFGFVAAGWTYCFVVVISRLAFLFILVVRERMFTSPRMLVGMVILFCFMCLVQLLYFYLIYDFAHHSIWHAMGCWVTQGLILICTSLLFTRLVDSALCFFFRSNHG